MNVEIGYYQQKKKNAIFGGHREEEKKIWAGGNGRPTALVSGYNLCPPRGAVAFIATGAHMQQLAAFTTGRRTLVKSLTADLKNLKKKRQLIAFLSSGKTVAGNCGLPCFQIKIRWSTNLLEITELVAYFNGFRSRPGIEKRVNLIWRFFLGKRKKKNPKAVGSLYSIRADDLCVCVLLNRIA